jgi:hypothetical protein
MLIYRRAGRLDQVDVMTAHRFQHFHFHFAVVEAPDKAPAEGHSQSLSYLFGKRAIRRTCKD